MWKTLLTTVIIFVFSFPLPALGQNMPDCDSILQYGVFDLTKQATSNSFYTQTIDYLKKQNFSSYEQARSRAASIGIPIPKFGALKLGSKNSGSSVHEVREALESLQKNESSGNELFKEEVSRANPDIINAWRDCAVQRNGPEVWAQLTSPNKFWIKANTVPIEGVEVILEEITVDDASCENLSKHNAKKIPYASRGNSFAFRCTATEGWESVHIIMTVNDSNGSFAYDRDFVLKNINLKTENDDDDTSTECSASFRRIIDNTGETNRVKNNGGVHIHPKSMAHMEIKPGWPVEGSDTRVPLRIDWFGEGTHIFDEWVDKGAELVSPEMEGLQYRFTLHEVALTKTDHRESLIAYFLDERDCE